MNSRLPSDIDWSRGARGIATVGAASAILFVAQVAIAGIANIELVSLLVMLFARRLGYRALYAIYTFVMLEGLLYGFHLWWISYMYVWAILAVITWLFRDMHSPMMMAVISGLFGLCFGALCAIPYFFIGGFSMAAAYWVAGIPFDLVHCAGNFVLCLLLWKPLYRAIDYAIKYSQL